MPSIRPGRTLASRQLLRVSARVPAALRFMATLSVAIWAASYAQEALNPKAADSAAAVRSIFVRSCYSCHGPKAQMAGLRLDSKASGMRVIQPGRPDQSELFRRVSGQGDQARMPMGGKP